MLNLKCKDTDIIDMLRLIRTPKIGPVACLELIRLFGDAKNALLYAADFAKRRSIALCSRESAEEELVKIRNYGGDVLTLSDSRYPQQLKNIYAPPPLLTVFGNVDALSNELIGVVGSREASINGKRFAKMLTQKLGENNLCVVSGMAIGIDSSAHQAAVESGRSTIAVLGSGINVVYPKINTNLYSKIVEAGGAIVSEFPFGESARSDNFPRRNRIISGLSKAVVIIEAGLKSGSLITAKFALEQNREVFAVPGSPFDSFSVGTNNLLKQGATLLTSVDDILNNIYLHKNDDLLRSRDFDEPCPNVQFEEVTRLKREILLRIGSSGIGMDLILAEFGRSPAIFLALVELEMEGLIYRDFHNHIYLLTPIEC